MRVVLALLLFASPAWAEPPALKLPAEVHGTSGAFVTVTAETAGKIVRWLPMDAGLSMIPSHLLRDTKTAVLMAPKGRYRLAAFTAAGDEPSEPAITVIVVDGAAPKPPDVTPTPVDPPPTEPTPPAPTGFYFLAVRPDGPAHPSFTAAMSLDAWGELRTKGHTIKDKTLTKARALGANIPAGTMLPCVIALRVEGNKSKQVGRPVDLPTTDSQVLALPEAIN